MSKPIKTQPIILDYAANTFADFALKNSDVGGKGLPTKNIENENRAVSTRIAYSCTTPGLVVIHAFAGPIFDNTVLNTFLQDRKFKASHLNPRKATADALRKIMFAARRRRETTWTDAEIEADIAHLLEEPKVKAYWEAA